MREDILNSFPREVVEFLCLEMFKKCVNVALGDTTCPPQFSGGSGSAGGIVGLDDLRGFLQPLGLSDCVFSLDGQWDARRAQQGRQRGCGEQGTQDPANSLIPSAAGSSEHLSPSRCSSCLWLLLQEPELSH